MKNLLKISAVALSLATALVPSARAASSWGVTFAGQTGAGSTYTDGSETITKAQTSYTSTGVSGLTLNISGAYATNGSGNKGLASGNWNTSTSTPEGATVDYYGGYGLAMDSNGAVPPAHALGNSGNTEAVLMSFSQAVALSSLNLGYVCTSTTNGTSCDSHGANVSIFAYTGTGTPTALSNVAANGMPSTAGTQASNGWTLVGNYAGLQGGANAVDASGITSSWFLVSAYNTAFGTSSANGNASWLSEGTDYFKIYSVAGSTAPTTKKTPEPGSLALAGVALLGAAWTRRRARKA